MRTPVRAIAPSVERWRARARWLRPLDMLATSALVWPVMAVWLDAAALLSLIASLAAVGGLALFPGVRLRWRPISGAVCLWVSRDLRPGDRGWYVLPDRAEPVIVTAKRRLRLVVAGPDQGPTEGLEVRRTRILVVSAER
jgi:hypothetical protein